MVGIAGSKRPDVSVVGAGPAGLVCTTVLARAGCSVTVHEWRDRVGSRFNGDFQGLENWSERRNVLEELKKAGIHPTFEHNPIYAGIAFDAWGKAYRVESDQPIYYLVRRGSAAGTLDRALLEQAVEAGVDVRFGSRARTAEGATVLATGPHAADAIAVGYVFETGMGDGQWICFDNALAPGGYAYLLVHRGRGTVATCMFTGFKHEAEYVARTVATFRRRVGLQMRNQKPFGVFDNFRLAPTALQGGRILIGEHAGFQDALVGFGMRYALRSAVLAARCILVGEDYDDRWRQELLPGLRTSVVNRLCFDLFGDRGRRWMLSHRLHRGDVRKRLFQLYRPSWFKAMQVPLARLHLGRRLDDPSCDHVDCSCVWCRCVDHEKIPGWR